jgi:hypothetical protein
MIVLAMMIPLLCILADLIDIVSGMVSSLPFTKNGLAQDVVQTEKALAIGNSLI